MRFDDSEQIQMSDISHHQGYPPNFPVVDFQKMRRWGFQGCVMRASHGPFADRAFTYNWPACKGVLPRSSYHYYENWAEPRAQADKYWSMVEHDFEGMAILDVEDNTNLKYYLWDDWYQWLERLKYNSGLPSDRIGIYSGYWYIKDILKTANTSEKEYFKQYKFWIAYYGNTGWNPLEPNFSEVPVPFPYEDNDVLAVQTGTPVIGKAAGVYSEELDYNRVNGRANFMRMFGQLQPQEPKANLRIQIRSIL